MGSMSMNMDMKMKPKQKMMSAKMSPVGTPTQADAPWLRA